jgi:pimeloyl-ACP methyl ester carboxylesterase
LIEESLPAITDIPTLLLWGERDTAVFLSSAQELHRRLPNSTVVEMKAIGHMPYEEVPQDFDRIVVDFLLHNTPAAPLQQEAGQPLG